jgi:excisionase family DNA binding protein
MRGFYTTHQAARLLGVSLPTVVNWIEARRLRAHRTPGGHRRIAREELASFVVRHGLPVPAELSGAAPVRRKALVLGQAGPAREGLARQLAEGGYAVEQASSGFAAGTAAARFQPDVVVLWVAFEGEEETLSDLRADRELGETPAVVVGLSGWPGALADSGRTAFLALPLAEGALVKAAGEVLGQATGLRSQARRR